MHLNAIPETRKIICKLLVFLCVFQHGLEFKRTGEETEFPYSFLINKLLLIERRKKAPYIGHSVAVLQSLSLISRVNISTFCPQTHLNIQQTFEVPWLSFCVIRFSFVAHLVVVVGIPLILLEMLPPGRKRCTPKWGWASVPFLTSIFHRGQVSKSLNTEAGCCKSKLSSPMSKLIPTPLQSNFP